MLWLSAQQGQVGTPSVREETIGQQVDLRKSVWPSRQKVRLPVRGNSSRHRKLPTQSTRLGVSSQGRGALGTVRAHSLHFLGCTVESVTMGHGGCHWPSSDSTFPPEFCSLLAQSPTPSYGPSLPSGAGPGAPPLLQTPDLVPSPGLLTLALTTGTVSPKAEDPNGAG